MREAQGSLVIVGSGILAGLHLTKEAESFIRTSDTVFYALTGEVSERWLRSLRPDAISLGDVFKEGDLRARGYETMVERLLQAVRNSESVCAVFYGHPGIFVRASHRAIQTARAEGFRAFMTPGVSAEACLFAELGIDPASHGCQSYDATDFLARHPRFEPTSALILWQIGVLNDPRARRGDQPNECEAALRALTGILQNEYPSNQMLILYEAADLPIAKSRIEEIELQHLPDARVTTTTTLYVSPLPQEHKGRATASDATS